MLPHERCLPTLPKSPESSPHKKKKKNERTIRKNKIRSQKKHAIKTLKVNTTTTGNSEHGHEPSSNCLQLHSAAPPDSQPKAGYLNSVTDQSPPTLCTDSVEDKKQKPNSKQQQLTYLHHNNNGNKTETTKFFTSVPKQNQN
jgi:hypothetical protein